MSRMQHNKPHLTPDVSVVIVTWNNLDPLRQCLDALERAIVKSGLDVEIIVVNNGSNDGTEEFLNSNNRLRQFQFGHNAGFGPASNQGITIAKAPLVTLLNDDILVDPGFLRPMIRHFDNPKVFAVAPFMILNGKPLPGRSVGHFRNGLLEISILNDHPDEPALVLFAGGGAGMFRMEMLMKLGCFDETYHPFYFEDLDLSYRAWKRGWICISEPLSIMHHHHEGTINKRFPKKYIYEVAFRNHILFHWKNIHDTKWISAHILRITRTFLWALISFNLNDVRAIFMALAKMGPVLRMRAVEKEEATIADRSLIHTISRNDI